MTLQPIAEPARPCGVLVIDKPVGCTSRAVVNRVNRWLGVKDAGHAGTLDPQASGLLVVAVGEATKTIRWMQDAPKTYRTTIALGTATVSDDADSPVLAHAPVPETLTVQQVQRTLQAWMGPLAQVPPQVSALQRDGVRDHQRVRQGQVVDRPPRQVMLYGATVLACVLPHIELELTCGAGFYVRALARDLGVALGTLGHVTALRRVAGAGFALADAHPLDDLLARDRAMFAELAVPMRQVLGQLLPQLQVDAATALMLQQGKEPEVRQERDGEAVAVHGDALIAIVRVTAGVAQVVRGFAHTAVRQPYDVAKLPLTA